MLTAILLLCLDAEAGKLAEGFRGIPYGPFELEAFEARIEAFGDICMGRSCDTNVGEVPVTVTYVAEHRIFYGFALSTKGNNCYALLRVLEAAYGPAEDIYLDGAPYKRWIDGDGIGGFSHNKYKETCLFTAASLT